MRRPRCLSCQERLWVDNAIGQLCIQHGVSDRDEDYRSTGWTAFLAAYRNFRPISSPAFWPYAYGQISAALAAEKRIRQDRVYKLLSLDAPIAADSDECLLQRLPARQGDFTNSVLFWDYIRRLPRRLFQLAWRLVNRDSLEEARSAMGLTEQNFLARCISYPVPPVLILCPYHRADPKQAQIPIFYLETYMNRIFG